MVRLTEEGIKWKLVNDRLVVEIYDDYVGSDIFEIVIFKDRLGSTTPWHIRRLEDNRDFREKDIDSLICWLLY